MVSGARVLVAALLLVLAGCTGGGEEKDPGAEPTAPAPAEAPAETPVLERPDRQQVRSDLRAAVRDPGSQQLPALPENPVIGWWYSLSDEENRCIITYGWSFAENDCVFGDTEGDREIVLWGDEQAAQWIPGLSDIAVETGRRVRMLAKYECPPLVGLTPWLATESRAHVECRSFNDNVLARLSANPPEMVVLSGGIRGTAYVVDGQVVELGITRPGNRWVPSPATRGIWHQGLASTLAALADLDVPVVVLGEVPALGIDPGVCLSRNPERPARCGARRDEVVLDDHADRVQELAEAQGATYVDTTRWLCNRRACPAVAGDTLTYRDSVLITSHYAQRLARVLGEEAGLLPQE